MPGTRPWTPHAGGLRVRLRVTPRAGRNAIEGIADMPDGPVLKVAVTGPPAEGKANAEVVRVLAKAMGIAKSKLAVESGARGRIKTVNMAGDSATLASMLEALAGAGRKDAADTGRDNK